MRSSPPKGTADASGGGKRYPAPPIPGPEELVELSNVERVTLRLLADAIVPRTGNTWEPLGGSASDLGVDDLAARAIQEYQPPDIQRQFRQLLKAVDSPATNLLLMGRPLRFRELGTDAREAYVVNWARSRLGVKRRGFHSIKRLIAFLYYSALTDDGRNRNWPALAYPGPDEAGREGRHTPPDLILVPTAVNRETTIETDLAVVGSGAGGAV
ncbi:MAG: gluconate 2-dehydrogenase subunit 3 family protein, partial [Methanobacteriota archaeon]